jgi:subtilase-type serine protease
MVPSYRVFGANRVFRRPSLLTTDRVQKRQVEAVPLAPASKERLKKNSAMRRSSLRLAAWLAVSVPTGLPLSAIAAPAGSPLAYTTLNFGTSGTLLTGIRGNNIVGFYKIPGTGDNGGLLYNISTGIWTPFPAATANGVNFPGAIDSSPYGPSFGSQFGILRAVGSYQTQSSSPYSLGYLYDGAAGPNGNLTTLVYPSTVRAQTLFTIAHSTFGNQVVGNYDTGLATGNAFIYTISTGAYRTNNFPGAVSTTAYGVWGNLIAGGYTPPGVGFERGYIYNQDTGSWTTYNHPGAVFTHFEGITGAGRGGEYNLVADWFGIDGEQHGSVLHIGADGSQTWIDLAVPGASVTSANSIFENQAIGIYVGASQIPNGFVVTIPGIYNPILNAGVLNTSTPNVPALSGGTGDDIVNNGTIHTTAANSSGISSGTYGVITNNGSITVTGPGSAAVEMNGLYGTLLNNGSIVDPPGSNAIRTGPSAVGTVIVNDGVIDGQIVVTPAGANARFENSGWLGISTPGAGATHLIGGTFVQTSTGTLALRIAPGSNDALQVTGAAILGGTLQLDLLNGFQSKISNQLTLVAAGGGISGKFANLLDSFSPVITPELIYGPNTVLLEFSSNFGSFALTPNQRAAAHLLDRVAFDPKAAELISFLFNEPVTNLPGDFDKISPDALTAFYEISFSNANIQKLNLEDRMDELHNGSTGFSSNMKVNGATVNLENRADADGKSSKAVVEPILQPGPQNRWGVWVTGFGDFVSVDADANANGYNFTTGGVSLGIDYRITDQLAIGVMGEYSHTWTSPRPSGNIDVNSGRGGVYATWSNHGIYLNAAIYGGYNSYHSSRSSLGGLATGNTEGAELSTFISGGYDFHFGHLTVGPIAALQYTYANVDGFSENGSLAPMQIESNSVNSLRSDVGFRIYYLWQIGKVLLEPSLKAAWEHEYLYSALPITAGFAGIPGPTATFFGPSEGHDSAIVSAGVSAQWTPAVSTYVNYDGQLGRGNYSSNAVTGGVRISF